MFDFAWTQIGLIGVVALVLIGPKDLPVAIKTVAGLVKKARRMAGEFQSHVDEMVKDTELADIRNQISELRNFDIRREVERAVDSDGAIRATFQQDPFGAMAPPPAAATSLTSGGIAAADAEAGHVTLAPAGEGPDPSAGPGHAPAFVPPQYVPAVGDAVASEQEPGAPAAPAFVAPAFVPPAYVPPPGSEVTGSKVAESDAGEPAPAASRPAA